MKSSMLKLLHIVGISLILATTISCYSTERKSVHIEKVRIATLGWMIQTEGRLSTEDMLLYTKERKESVFDTVVSNRSILSAFEQLQARKTDSISAERLNVMTVCFLYNSDRTIDTISFGRGWVYQFNGRWYSISQSVINLLRSIANICPPPFNEGMLYQLEAIEEQMTTEQKQK